MNNREFTTFDGQYSYTRTTAGYALGADGLYHKVPAGEPRRFFNPDGTFRGLIKEAQQTNLVPWSDFSSGFSWNVDGNYDRQTIPGGFRGLDCERIVINSQASTNGPYLNIYGAYDNSSIYTAYFYARSSNNGVATAALAVNSGASPDTIVTLTQEWQKLELTWDSSLGSNILTMYTDQVAGEYVEYAQMQVVKGDFSTSPIVTKGSQVSRAEEHINTAVPLDNTENTLFIELAVEAFNRSYGVIAGYGPSAGKAFPQTSITKNVQLSPDKNNNRGGDIVIDWSSFNRVATSWDGSSMRMALNGNESRSINYGITPANRDIRFLQYGIGRAFIKKIYYMPRNSTEAELKEMTK